MDRVNCRRHLLIPVFSVMKCNLWWFDVCYHAGIKWTFLIYSTWLVWDVYNILNHDDVQGKMHFLINIILVKPLNTCKHILKRCRRICIYMSVKFKESLNANGGETCCVLLVLCFHVMRMPERFWKDWQILRQSWKAARSKDSCHLLKPLICKRWPK